MGHTLAMVAKVDRPYISIQSSWIHFSHCDNGKKLDFLGLSVYKMRETGNLYFLNFLSLFFSDFFCLHL